MLYFDSSPTSLFRSSKGKCLHGFVLSKSVLDLRNYTVYQLQYITDISATIIKEKAVVSALSFQKTMECCD